MLGLLPHGLQLLMLELFVVELGRIARVLGLLLVLVTSLNRVIIIVTDKNKTQRMSWKVKRKTEGEQTERARRCDDWTIIGKKSKTKATHEHGALDKKKEDMTEKPKCMACYRLLRTTRMCLSFCMIFTCRKSPKFTQTKDKS